MKKLTPAMKKRAMIQIFAAIMMKCEIDFND